MLSAQRIIIDGSVGVAVILVVAYIAYMIGLILVLRRLGRVSWHAFIPLLNYYAQIRAINAPGRWFLLSLPPYIGAAYAGSAAIRLGAIFGRGPAFSLIWLTFGAPIGMFVLAFTRRPIDHEILNEKAHLLDLKAIKRLGKARPTDNDSP